jgi:hypothetical protein
MARLPELTFIVLAIAACSRDRAITAASIANDSPSLEKGCQAALPGIRYLRGEEMGIPERGVSIDLDHDGRPERWAPAPGLCSGAGNCVYALSDGATCKTIGVVGGAGLDLRVLGPGRWPEFVVAEQVVGTLLEARYRWNGAAYRPVAARVCLTREDPDPDRRQCDPWSQLSGAPYPINGERSGWPRLTDRGEATKCDSA